MKRYNLEEQGVPYEMSDRVMVEHPEGEWVRWEDVEKSRYNNAVAMAQAMAQGIIDNEIKKLKRMIVNMKSS